MVDVAVHRVVAYRDLVDAQFGGHPYSARRGIDRLTRAGLLQERTVAGPKGGSYKVLTATQGGARVAEKLAEKHGFGPSQKAWSGLGREKDVTHDVAIYRAVIEARQQLAGQGATVRRVRLDAELRSEVASRSEAARVKGGKVAADEERWVAARELQLPIQDNGSVACPDAQIEWERSGDGGEGPSSGASTSRSPASTTAAVTFRRRPRLASRCSPRTARPARRWRRPAWDSGRPPGHSGARVVEAVVAVVAAARTEIRPAWRSDDAAIEGRRGTRGRFRGRGRNAPPASIRVPGPIQRLIVRQYWLPVLLYSGAALFTLVVLIGATARSVGLVDVGKTVDLVERSIRRGEGDPDLSRRLQEEDRGDFSE